MERTRVADVLASLQALRSAVNAERNTGGDYAQAGDPRAGAGAVACPADVVRRGAAGAPLAPRLPDVRPAPPLRPGSPVLAGRQ
jgi:hypothetical protein